MVSILSKFAVWGGTLILRKSRLCATASVIRNGVADASVMGGVFVSFALLAFVIFSPPVHAQDVPKGLKNISQAAQGIIDDGAQSQDRINKIDDEYDVLLQDYRASLVQLQDLRKYNGELVKLIKAQETEMVSIREQIDGVTNVDRSIVPLMLKMVDALAAFVALDVPFLLEQRKQRVANLRELMGRSDANPAEKYRNILEAYEIENEYGRTIEAYEETIDLEGEERVVTFLKIGRVALIYQTLDGDESGAWNAQTRVFDDLDGDFDSEIRDALRVAKEQAAPNLLIIPLAPSTVAVAKDVAPSTSSEPETTHLEPLDK